MECEGSCCYLPFLSSCFSLLLVFSLFVRFMIFSFLSYPSPLFPFYAHFYLFFPISLDILLYLYIYFFLFPRLFLLFPFSYPIPLLQWDQNHAFHSSFRSLKGVTVFETDYTEHLVRKTKDTQDTGSTEYGFRLSPGSP